MEINVNALQMLEEEWEQELTAFPCCPCSTVEN